MVDLTRVSPGDKLVVSSKNHSATWVPPMDVQRGKVVTVRRVLLKTNYPNYRDDYVLIEEDTFYYAPEDFEWYADEPSDENEISFEENDISQII